MACPVNHPFFHAFVFFIGVLIVLSRYARAADVPSHLFASPLAHRALPLLTPPLQHIG